MKIQKSADKEDFERKGLFGADSKFKNTLGYTANCGENMILDFSSNIFRFDV
ncbi:MAG: hypothetical protein JJU02_06240 [Cryomorphaceae bacterium]|nr:hypothetical protein [Cryomorphaceae bacterium]